MPTATASGASPCAAALCPDRRCGCSPAAASWPAPIPRPSSPRPRPSSCRSGTRSDAERMDRADRTEAERRLDRVVRAAGVPDLVEALTERLSPTDLQTLLLEVYRRRAAAVTPSRLLARYEDNRFVVKSPVDPLDLARLEASIHDRLPAHDITGLTLSPVSPLGTNAAIATVDQNNVLSTIRNTEVVSDATNVLALECAVRRRALLRADPRSRDQVRLGATH